MLDAVLCEVKWLTCWWWNVITAVSGCRHVFIFVVSLGPDVVLAVLVASWQWHLGLFNCGGLCLSLLQWGALFSLLFLWEVYVWTLLQWLQHLCSVSWIAIEKFITIFENGKCLLLIVFKLEGLLLSTGPESIWSCKGCFLLGDPCWSWKCRISMIFE